MAGVGADFQQALFFIGSVHAYSLADDRRAEDDGFAVRGARGHGSYELEVVLTGLVGEVDGSAGDAPTGGMEGGVWVRGLEHVPVWEDVEVRG